MKKRIREKREKVKDTIQIYFEDMGETPLLTREEEVDLAKKIEAGKEAQLQNIVIICMSQMPLIFVEDKPNLAEVINKGFRARQKLISFNLRLVVSIAKIYAKMSQRLSLLHLIQEGNLGLITAAERFDWRRGCKFSTHATWHIQRFIRKALHRDRQMRNIIKFSIDRQVEDRQGEKFVYALKDEKAISPSSAMNKKFTELIVRGALARLTYKERLVIRMIYGLDDGISHSGPEIAKVLGKTREWVRQIKNRALGKLGLCKELSDFA